MSRERLRRQGIPPAALGLRYWDWNPAASTVADGVAVASLPDVGPEGVAMAQAIGSLQPLMKRGVNGLNGLPALLGDGVDDVMAADAVAAAFTGAGNKACTALIVGTINAAAASGCPFSLGRQASSTPSHRLSLGSSENYRITRTGDAGVVKSGITAVAAALNIPFVWLSRTSGYDGDHWINGRLITRLSDLESGTITLDTCTLFARRGASVLNRWPGLIGRAVLFQGWPTDGQAFLLSRWAMNLFRVGG